MNPCAASQLGGGEGATEEVQADQEAAIVYCGEVLPKSSSVWLSLRYEVRGTGRGAVRGSL